MTAPRLLALALALGALTARGAGAQQVYSIGFITPSAYVYSDSLARTLGADVFGLTPTGLRSSQTPVAKVDSAVIWPTHVRLYASWRRAKQAPIFATRDVPLIWPPCVLFAMPAPTVPLDSMTLRVMGSAKGTSDPLGWRCGP